MDSVPSKRLSVEQQNWVLGGGNLPPSLCQRLQGIPEVTAELSYAQVVRQDPLNLTRSAI